MAVSLAEAKNNATTDVDVAVIDEFRKESTVLDTMIFDDAVNPSGGGGTLTYGYRRLATQPTADTRAIGLDEYAPGSVTTTHHTVDLAVMGGSFEVDRVLAKIGPAASGAVQLNLDQKIKATRTKFQDMVVNGDSDIDANSFDGLSKALTGSSTETKPTTMPNWSDLDTDARMAYKALDVIDEFLGELDGTPTVILGNKKALARVRAIVRRSGLYVVDPIEGLVGANGRPITRESYGGVIFADPGEKAGSTDLIIPIRKQVSVNPTVTASSGTISFKVNGQTVTIAYDANAAAWQTAIRVHEPAATVTGTTTKLVVFPVGSASTLAAVTDGGVTFADAGSTDAPVTGLTDLYAYRIGLDGFHGVATMGGQLVQTWLPDFGSAGALKKGEVELGPVAVALKATKAAAVLRGIKVQ